MTHLLNSRALGRQPLCKLHSTHCTTLRALDHLEVHSSHIAEA